MQLFTQFRSFLAALLSLALFLLLFSIPLLQVKEAAAMPLSSFLYIDDALPDVHLLRQAVTNVDDEAFHLFSHGRPGRLLLDGRWRAAPQIVAWISDGRLAGKTRLHIYGCEFAKGETGRQAVAYLQATLGIAVAASDDITGPDGDWQLEVATPRQHHNTIIASYYPHNLQLGQRRRKPPVAGFRLPAGPFFLATGYQ